jgi:hypothetical protein
MTLLFESHTLWLSTCEISYWWNVLLLDIWSFNNTNHVSFDEMTQTPFYGGYTKLLRTYGWFQHRKKDCTWIVKYYTCRCIVFIQVGYHYFAFFVRNPKWIFDFTGFWIYLMYSKDFRKEEGIIIKSLWFWSKWQDYKLWFWCKNL